MACGTPTIAFSCGSVPEVISEGITGYIVSSVEEAVDAVGKADRFDRVACRAEFERRFSANTMASGYVKIYEALVCPRPTEPSAEIDTLLTL